MPGKKKEAEDVLVVKSEEREVSVTEKGDSGSEGRGDLSEQSAELMGLAMDRLRRELENTKKSIPLNQLTSAICTLYEKCSEGKDEGGEGTGIEVNITVVE